MNLRNLGLVTTFGLIGALGPASAAVPAQDATATVLSHGFEENDGGWTSPAGTGAVAVTHDPNLVKTGKGALQFKYSLKKGEFGLLLLPTPDMLLSKAKSIRFWIKADHAAPIAVVLQEKDSGRYTAVFTSQKDTWQEVELSTGDFVLDMSKDAPKDFDGKLDMDQVEAIGMTDMAQFFLQGDPAVAAVFGVSEGPRALSLDDFSVSSTAVGASATLKGGEGSFDIFNHPQIGWIATGEVQVTKIAGKPLEGAGMQAKYHQGPMKIAGLSRFVPAGGLTGASKLMISAASLKPAKIVIQVEERGGGKYNTTIELPGNSGRADLTVNFADFKPSQDSHDDNNRLDLDQVSQIILLDASGLLDAADGNNTLWINNVKASR